MDDDIKKERPIVETNQYNSLLEYKPNRSEIPPIDNDSLGLYNQEEDAFIRVKKIREASERVSAHPYPWEIDTDNEEALKKTESKNKENTENRVYVVTSARVREMSAKNKGSKTYVITSVNNAIPVESSTGTYSMITPPKYNGSIGEVKKYTVSGKPDIFIQEINPLSIRINFEVNFSKSSFVRRNVGEWMNKKFMNFMNFSYFETKDTGWEDGVPTGQFIAFGRNFGAKTNKGSSWSDQPVIIIRPGKIPIFDRGSNWYNAFNSNEVFKEKSGQHGFISNNINEIQGESAVAANTPLFFERGNMRRNFSSTLLGPGKYNPRGFIGSLKNGKWFVGVTGGGGNRSSSKNGYDAREVAEALNKIYVNQIDYAMGTDSGGSTSFVSGGNIIYGSRQGRAIPVILSW